MPFDLEEATALYERESNRPEPRHLEEWFEERIKEAIRAGDTELRGTTDDIPSRFQGEDLHSALMTFHGRGFHVHSSSYDYKIFGWAD